MFYPSVLEPRQTETTFFVACLCRGGFSFLSVFCSFSLFWRYIPSWVSNMFQFGYHLAWTQADAPAADISIIVYLPPEIIFKMFVSIAYAPTNQNRCRLSLFITSEHQTLDFLSLFLLFSWPQMIFLTFLKANPCIFQYFQCFQNFS